MSPIRKKLSSPIRLLERQTTQEYKKLLDETHTTTKKVGFRTDLYVLLGRLLLTNVRKYVSIPTTSM